MKIIVVGVGALGSHLALFVRNLVKDHEFWFVDFDKIEHKNLLGQAHSKMVLGQNKANAIDRTLQGMWGIHVASIPHRLTLDNVNVILEGADLIVDCVDNAEARHLIQNYARGRMVPCVHGALSADGSFGQVLWEPEFVVDAEGSQVATCEGGENLPFHALVAAQLAIAVQTFVETDKKVGFQLTPNGVQRV